jgi:hypothetical protein
MKGFLLTCLPFFLIWGSSWAASASPGKVEIQPPSLARNLFVEKANLLTFRGAAPDGARIVIKIAGPEGDFKLNKSGKVFGFLWVPVRHAVAGAVPAFFAVLSSEKEGSPFFEEEQKAAGISPAFRQWPGQGKVTFLEKTDPEEAETLSGEFLQGLIRLLQEKGLYRQDETAVRVAGGRFEARLRLPAEAPLGEYEVFVYALKDRGASLLDRGVFTVGAEGLAAWLARQARENPAAYGVLAVLIALGAGTLVGVIFQLGGRR